MEQAQAFAAAVKSQFHLDGRVFDDADEAERAHLFPWRQIPPVVHIDRPHWEVDPHDDKAWKKARKIEDQIEKLAVKFGGSFVGT